MKQEKQLKTEHQLLLAFFKEDHLARKALQSALDSDIQMDRVSILGPASSSGDDPLGIYFPSIGEKAAGWGKMGALWGGLWGLLTGAMGMFLIPGLGPIIAFGPIVEALIGAGIGAGALAGASAISQLGVAVHRMGVPQDQIDAFHNRLEQGQYLFMLIVGNNETDRWLSILSQHNPELLVDYPYVGYADAVKNTIEEM
jgi:hypothetical protein